MDRGGQQEITPELLNSKVFMFIQIERCSLQQVHLRQEQELLEDVIDEMRNNEIPDEQIERKVRLNNLA